MCSWCWGLEPDFVWHLRAMHVGQCWGTCTGLQVPFWATAECKWAQKRALLCITTTNQTYTCDLIVCFDFVLNTAKNLFEDNSVSCKEAKCKYWVMLIVDCFYFFVLTFCLWFGALHLELQYVQFSSVQFRPLTDWVVEGTREKIR